MSLGLDSSQQAPIASPPFMKYVVIDEVPYGQFCELGAEHLLVGIWGWVTPGSCFVKD